MTSCLNDKVLVCRNGGTSIQDKQIRPPRCDCSATPKVATAGDACEFKATVYCTVDGSFSRTNLCTCKLPQAFNTDAHFGCDCLEGWHGRHCEDHSEERASIGGESTALVILSGVMIIGVITVFLVVWVGVQGYKTGASTETSDGNTVSSERSDDETEADDVERQSDQSISVPN